MSLVKRNGNYLTGFPAFFNDFFSRDLWNQGLDSFSNTGTTIPAVNIKETNDNFVVEMAAPGMSKEDFKIELDRNMLTITSEKNYEKEENTDERYSKREFSYQSFSRVFTLPKEVVDADKIEAKYDNGLLHLVIPKKEEAKQRPPRTIQIA
jgi:HSP20 family protein